MFPDYHVMIQGFIPKSLGKPMRAYFQHNPLFRPDRLINYEEFERFLRSTEALPGTWLPEPMPLTPLGSYYLTNDGEIGNHKDYKVRLAGTLDLSKVGRYRATDQPLQVITSSDTHRCTAAIAPARIIRPNGTIDELSKAKAEFAGPQSKTPFVRGHYQSPVNSFRATSLRPGNVLLGRRPQPRPTNSGPSSKAPNATSVEAWASGGYPFFAASPGINVQLRVSMVRLGNLMEITVTGEHDRFPAYEVYVNGRLRYSYNPVAHGQHGPSPFNLNANYFDSIGIARAAQLGSVPFTLIDTVQVPARRPTAARTLGPMLPTGR